MPLAVYTAVSSHTEAFDDTNWPQYQYLLPLPVQAAQRQPARAMKSSGDRIHAFAPEDTRL